MTNKKLKPGAVQDGLLIKKYAEANGRLLFAAMVCLHRAGISRPALREAWELYGKVTVPQWRQNGIVRMRTAPEASKLLKERIPYGMTNTICFMDYRKITDTASWQYKLQQECETTVLSGIRIYTDASGNEYLCTALGSAYGRDIGDTWRVTLECGTELDIIYAEYKDDGTTDFFGHPDDNYDGQDCINILEFIVDVNQMPTEALDKGTFTALSYFGGLSGNGGNIAKMKYTGRVWEP